MQQQQQQQKRGGGEGNKISKQKAYVPKQQLYMLSHIGEAKIVFIF